MSWTLLRRYRQARERGASLLECLVLLALIGVACLVGVQHLGSAIATNFHCLADRVATIEQAPRSASCTERSARASSRPPPPAPPVELVQPASEAEKPRCAEPSHTLLEVDGRMTVAVTCPEPKPPGPSYFGRVRKRIGESFGTLFERPLGLGPQYDQAVEELPDWASPLALVNRTFGAAVTVIDGTVRVIQGTGFALVDVAAETLQTAGLIDRGNERFARDLKSMMELGSAPPTLGAKPPNAPRGPALPGNTLREAGRQAVHADGEASAVGAGRATHPVTATADRDLAYGGAGSASGLGPKDVIDRTAPAGEGPTQTQALKDAVRAEVTAKHEALSRTERTQELMVGGIRSKTTGKVFVDTNRDAADAKGRLNTVVQERVDATDQAITTHARLRENGTSTKQINEMSDAELQQELSNDGIPPNVQGMDTAAQLRQINDLVKYREDQAAGQGTTFEAVGGYDNIRGANGAHGEVKAMSDALDELEKVEGRAATAQDAGDLELYNLRLPERRSSDISDRPFPRCDMCRGLTSGVELTPDLVEAEKTVDAQKAARWKKEP